MQYFAERKKIFILGPDNNRLLRDSIESGEYFYFDPESGIIPWNIKIIAHTFIYFFSLYDLKIPFCNLLMKTHNYFLVQNLLDK